MSDLFTIKIDTNPSPWLHNYVEIEFSKSKLQPVVDELVLECSGKNYNSAYSYDPLVERVIRKRWDESCGSVVPFMKAIRKMLLDQCPDGADWSDGYVASARSIRDKLVWMSPGFVEARRYSDLYGG